MLHGAHAMAAAVDRRLTVELVPRDDRRIEAQSDLGVWRTSLDDFQVNESMRFAGEAVRMKREALPSGADLRIVSDIPNETGLGTSAAVTAAVLAALRAWLNEPDDPAALHAECLRVIRAVQGRGSGADAAASVFGGVVKYRADPVAIHIGSIVPPVALVYAGYKRPTAEVIERVETRRRKYPELFEQMFALIDDTVGEAWIALHAEHWLKLGQLMAMNQDVMEAMGVCDKKLSEMLEALHRQPGVLGCKISGSGLGDCVWALGEVQPEGLPGTLLDAQIGREGVRVD